MKDEDVINAILILRLGMTPIAKQAVQEVSDSVHIEHFMESELLVDITEHKLVRFFCFSISCLYLYNVRKNH